MERMWVLGAHMNLNVIYFTISLAEASVVAWWKMLGPRSMEVGIWFSIRLPESHGLGVDSIQLPESHGLGVDSITEYR